MRQFILITILFSSNLILAQSKLIIIPCFCQLENEVSNFDHVTQLYNKDSFITDKFYPINDFTVEGLKKGKYLLKYKSIFNQDYELEINLKKKKKKIKICIDDYRPKTKITQIDKLEEGDTLQLWSYSTGCEYDDFGKIQLTKEDGLIKAILIKDNIICERIIGEKEKNLIREMEQKIQLIKDDEGSHNITVIWYEIKFNGEEKVKTLYWYEPIDYRANIKKIFELN